MRMLLLVLVLLRVAHAAGRLRRAPPSLLHRLRHAVSARVRHQAASSRIRPIAVASILHAGVLPRLRIILLEWHALRQLRLRCHWPAVTVWRRRTHVDNATLLVLVLLLLVLLLLRRGQHVRADNRGRLRRVLLHRRVQQRRVRRPTG
jgi:hypothetical protein